MLAINKNLWFKDAVPDGNSELWAKNTQNCTPFKNPVITLAGEKRRTLKIFGSVAKIYTKCSPG